MLCLSIWPLGASHSQQADARDQDEKRNQRRCPKEAGGHQLVEDEIVDPVEARVLEALRQIDGIVWFERHHLRVRSVAEYDARAAQGLNCILPDEEPLIR